MSTNKGILGVSSTACKVLFQVRMPPRILVAEDDPEMRNIIAWALREEGYDVLEAQDGARFLLSIANHYAYPEASVDLIISDIRMPVCSGLDIVAKIRRANWSVPIILMTAFGDEETKRKAEEYSATLLDKPFALDDLKATVFNALHASEPQASSHFDPTGHFDPPNTRR